MVRTLIATAFFALAACGSLAQTVGEKIETVIGQQIEAFQADDFARAFSFASPMIQQMFGSSDRFGLMVRQGYPMVWRPEEVTFLERRSEGAATFQQVLVQDAAGRLHTLEYQMVEGPDGWRINGVMILRAQVGA